jgi:hypothetical protein
MTRALLATLLWSATALAGPPLLDPPTARPTATAAEPAPREAPSMSAVPDSLAGPEAPVRMPPMAIAPSRSEPDRRPAYVGLGLVVMATALWWNRRQRDRFDREDDRARRPRRVRDAERDADADDLHAAARGDLSDRPDA